MGYSTEEIEGLVQPTKFHRNLATDPEIFDLELERIWVKAVCADVDGDCHRLRRGTLVIGNRLWYFGLPCAAASYGHYERKYKGQKTICH